MTLPEVTEKQLVDIQFRNGMDESVPEEHLPFTKALVLAKNVRVDGGKLVTRPGVDPLVLTTDINSGAYQTTPIRLGRTKTGLALIAHATGAVGMYQVNRVRSSSSPASTGAKFEQAGTLPEFSLRKITAGVAQADSTGFSDAGVYGVAAFTKVYAVLHAAEPNVESGAATDLLRLTFVDRKTGAVIRTLRYVAQVASASDDVQGSMVGVADRYLHLYITGASYTPSVIVIDTENIPSSTQIQDLSFTELTDATPGMRIGGVVANSSGSVVVTYDPVLVEEFNNSGVSVRNTALTDMVNATGIDHNGGNYWIIGEDAGAFDPATLDLTLWVRAAYAGSPWVGVASAGGSGSINLTEATNPPSVGALLNGLATADFDGTNDILGNATQLTTLLSADSYSVWVLMNVDSISTDSASGWANDGVLSASGATEWSIFLRSSGLVGVNHHDGSHKKAEAAFTIGQWQLVQARYTGTNLQVRVNNGAWSTTAAGNVSSLAYALLVGNNAFGGRLNGRVADIGMAASSFDDATFDNIREYVNNRYGLAV